MSALASLERFGEEGLVFINWRYVQTLFTKRMAFKTFFFFPFSSWSFSTDWLYVELWLVELGCYNVRDAHWLPSILLRNTLRNPSQDHELEGNPGIPTRGAHFRISERDNQKVKSVHFKNSSSAILSSLKIMIIFNITSAESKQSLLMHYFIIILSELRIAQLCS